jgi:Family of unknown function (DUF6328)
MEPNDEARQETLAQRDDRNFGELVQELRVVGLGVQVLFGFLLSLPFTVKFAALSQGQRDLYVACITLASVAIVLLLGPVAYHRLIFREGMKESLVLVSNVMAICGLAAVAGAVLSAVFLVVGYVAGTLPAALITALVGVMLAALWFALPLARRAARRGTQAAVK